LSDPVRVGEAREAKVGEAKTVRLHRRDAPAPVWRALVSFGDDDAEA
jgi:hypothetical protein